MQVDNMLCSTSKGPIIFQKYKKLFRPFLEHILWPLLGLFWKTDRWRTDKVSTVVLASTFLLRFLPYSFIIFYHEIMLKGRLHKGFEPAVRNIKTLEFALWQHDLFTRYIRITRFSPPRKNIILVFQFYLLFLFHEFA